MNIKPLPSVENLTKDWGMLKNLPNDLIDYDKYRVEDVQDLLTQDRDQAYTSVVEGIKAQVKDINGEGSVFDDFANDILENVVKPLYGKE